MDKSNSYKKPSVLWTLAKIKLVEFLRGGGSKKNKKGKVLGTTALAILYIFSFLAMSVAIGFFFFGIGVMLGGKSYDWVYFAYMAIGMFLLCFIGSVFMTETQMFEAKDNERLLSMPISPWSILVSRMISLLFYNYLFGALVGVPAGITYIVMSVKDIFGKVTPLGVIFYLVALLMVPLLALAISMLVGWGISVLTAKVKSTKIIKLVIAIAAALLYFYFIMADGGWAQNLIVNAGKIAKSIKAYIPPAYSVGKAITDQSLLHFGLMLLWCLVPFIVVSFLVSRNFLKIISLGGNQTKFKYKSIGARVRSPRKSFIKMELDRFFSSITYIMNGGMGLIFMVILPILALTNKSDLKQMVGMLKYAGIKASDLIGPGIVIAILGVMAMVTISSASISLDAKTLWQAKSMPINGGDIFLTKAVPHILISVPFILVASILLQLNFNIPLVDRVLVVLVPQVANIFNALMGVRLNAKFPKFNWTNEAQAIKQGIAVLFAMLFGALPPLILGILLGFLTYKGGIDGTLFLVGMLALYIVAALVMYLRIKKRGDDIINSLEI